VASRIRIKGGFPSPTAAGPSDRGMARSRDSTAAMAPTAVPAACAIGTARIAVPPSATNTNDPVRSSHQSLASDSASIAAPAARVRPDAATASTASIVVSVQAIPDSPP
jgi:hypothetical protein